MKSLQINIPEGFEIGNFDTKTGEVTFKAKPKCIMERIQSLDDIFSLNGTNSEEFNTKSKGLTEDEVSYRLMKLITKAYNEGAEIDWANDKPKYNPCFYMKEGVSGFRPHGYVNWRACSFVGSRLCFILKAHMDDATSKFPEVYKNFMF